MSTTARSRCAALRAAMPRLRAAMPRLHAAGLAAAAALAGAAAGHFRIRAQPKQGGPQVELGFRERMGRRAGR